MRSIRSQLIVAVMAATAAAALLSGAALYALARARLLDRFDAALVDRAAVLRSAFEFEDGTLDIDFEGVPMPGEGGGMPREAVWCLRDGVVLHEHGAETFGDGVDLAAVPARSEAGGIAWLRVESADTPACRVLRLRFTPRVEGWERDANRPRRDHRESDDEHEGVDDNDDDEEHHADGDRQWLSDLELVVVRDAGAVVADLEGLLRLLVTSGLLAIALVWAAGLAAVGLAMRPVDDLARRIESIDARTLDGRLDTDALPAELRPIALRFNALLERVRVSLERERAFSGNLAHELRTPLAGLRSQIDVALARSREGEAYRRVLTTLSDVALGLERLVESLLVLSTLESGGGEAAHEQEREAVAIVEACERVWAEVRRDVAPGKPYEFRFDADEACGVEIVTQPRILEIVLRNLFGNAVTHVDDGGRIVSGVRQEDGVVCVWVRNTGSRVKREDVHRVFNRFWRGDPSRRRAWVGVGSVGGGSGGGSGAGSGIGLSLVRAACAVLDAEVVVDSEHGGAFEVEVWLK